MNPELHHCWRIDLPANDLQVCRERNDVSPTQHEFLMQGTDKVYIIHFPMFHLEKHRHQLIIEVKLDDAAMKEYKTQKAKNPTATFKLHTLEDIALAPMVAGKKPFKASITMTESGKCVLPLSPKSSQTPDPERRPH